CHGRAAHARARIGEPTGGAVRHGVAHRRAAPSGARAGRHRHLRESRPGPHLPARSRCAGSCERLDRGPAPAAGSSTRSPGRLPDTSPEHDQGKRKTEMTKRSQTHATFVLERAYPVPVERVWEAFANPEIKRQWFGSPEFTEQERREDFRVGGVAIHDGRRPKTGPLSQFRATYTDIVPHERIVYT